MTSPNDIAAVTPLLHLDYATIEKMTGVPAEVIAEIEERIAVRQEANGGPIDVVPRDMTTGKRTKLILRSGR